MKEICRSNTRAQSPAAHEWQLMTLKAKFHYASWFEAGSKLVADRFEAGRRQASNLSATSFEPASV